MSTAIIILSILLVLALIGWAWAEVECNAQKRRAHRIEQYNNWIETRHNLAVARLKSLGERFD